MASRASVFLNRRHPHRPSYFSEIPAAFELRNGEVLIVPAYHVFGSEELSILSPGIAERAPKPYIAINADDANRYVISVKVIFFRIMESSIAGSDFKIACQRTCGIPYGLPDLQWSGVPFWFKLIQRKNCQWLRY